MAAEIKKVFSKDLAKKATLKASNVRGNSPEYSANKCIDDKKDSYWATDDGVKTASLTINLGKPTTFNRFLVQEPIKLGQRVKSFTVSALVNGEWKELGKGTTIGYKRILRLPTVKATQLRLNITDSKGGILISNIGIYNAPQIMTAPTIIREQSGDVVITPSDPESEIFYTFDGSTPTIKSKKYTNSIKTNDGKVQVKAIAYNPISKKSSLITEEKFGIARTTWKIVGIDDKNTANIIDGKENTSWHQPQSVTMPVDLIIDLGKTENLTGFKYLPDQNWWADGIVSKYKFYVSQDNKEWQLVDEGEFANIKHNPLWQIKSFKSVKARFIKFSALQNTENNNAAGYSEIDVITE